MHSELEEEEEALKEEKDAAPELAVLPPFPFSPSLDSLAVTISFENVKCVTCRGFYFCNSVLDMKLTVIAALFERTAISISTSMELGEFEHEQCKDGMVKTTVKETWMEAGLFNNFACKAIQHEAHRDFSPTPKDDAEVEDLFFYPQNEKDLSGDMMLLDSGHVREGLATEDFTFSVDYANPKSDIGKSYTDTALVQDYDLMHEFVDSLFKGVDEEVLCTHRNFSSAPEFFWDDGYAESFAVKYASQSTSCIKNLRSELAIKSTERHSDTCEISDMSTALISPCEDHPDRDGLFLDGANTNKLPDAIGSNLGQDISAQDKQSLERDLLLGFQNLNEIDNFSSPFQFCYNSNENEGEMVWMPNKFFAVPSVLGSVCDGSKMVGMSTGEVGHPHLVGSLAKADSGFKLLNSEDEESPVITNKRLRKRTQRYIEETFDLKSKCCKETGGPVLQKPKDPCTYEGHPRRNDAYVGNETIGVDEISCSSEYRSMNALCCNKPASPNNGSEDSTEDFRIEKRRPRKHHRVWTLPEVMKLIDGVSRYGVGKWTEIKRLLFPTSAFRTSVDLKDKWRNLLRASATLSHKRKQVESHKKNVHLPIPPHVLRRVRELSAIHPYPSDRKSRVLSASSNPVLSCGGGGGGHRMVIRKCSFT